MGILAWIALLAVSAAIATVVQFALFRDRKPTDYDWVYLAGGSLIGGFTGHVWYSVGPTFDGLYVVPALVAALVGAALVEGLYRFWLRRRQPGAF